MTGRGEAKGEKAEKADKVENAERMTKSTSSPQISIPVLETLEKIDLSVLLKFIKPFDGSRQKLNPFISNCQSAYNLATKHQKPILFKYMLSQLTDRAESSCNIKEFDNFDQFVEFLKQQFGERKHYTHLLSELQDSKQGPMETVNQYALRVETILSQLLTETKMSVKKKSEVAGRVAAMEDLALHTFTIGLQPRLSQVVRCRDPDSLNAAVSFAVAEEKILAASYKKSNSNVPDKPKFTSRQQQSQPQPNRYSNAQNSRPDSSKKVNTGDLVCRYCKNVGHTIDNCRKRQYNNSRNQSNQPNAPSSATRQTNSPQDSVHNQPRGAVNVIEQSQEYGVDEVDDTNYLNE